MFFSRKWADDETKMRFGKPHETVAVVQDDDLQLRAQEAPDVLLPAAERSLSMQAVS